MIVQPLLVCPSITVLKSIRVDCHPGHRHYPLWFVDNLWVSTNCMGQWGTVAVSHECSLTLGQGKWMARRQAQGMTRVNKAL